MGYSVSVHGPKTPITENSGGVAKATIPNVCKMPGPPAPFVPAPLPNIGKSELSPKGYSKTVKIEGSTVAIRGATFNSMGDMASKGTGGGLISANTHGPTKFITPGSMTVKIEGKAVHLKGEPMLNNCGPNGSPPNTGATMLGADNKTGEKPAKCPPHDWEIVSAQTPEETKAENSAKAAELRARGGKNAIRQAETLDFEIKAIDANMDKMQIDMTNVKIKCKDCPQDGQIDIIGDEQIAEAQSVSAENYRKDKKKEAQAERLVEFQNMMNGVNHLGPQHQPISKHDNAQHGDGAKVREVCARRKLTPEFL
jgi:uncharacterized Zn-binding protein involved in type VI secretion